MNVNTPAPFGDFGSVLGSLFGGGGPVGPVDTAVLAETLQPRPMDRPPADPQPCDIRLPRSARRAYSHAERCAATAMLAKLRARADQPPLAGRGRPVDAGRALDVAVDRLLDVL